VLSKLDGQDSAKGTSFGASSIVGGHFGG